MAGINQSQDTSWHKNKGKLTKIRKQLEMYEKQGDVNMEHNHSMVLDLNLSIIQ